MTTHFPEYSFVYEWLAKHGWLVLQYMPANAAKVIGAEIIALSPVGIEWRFHFNLQNDLVRWDCLAEVKVSGDISTEVRRP